MYRRDHPPLPRRGRGRRRPAAQREQLSSPAPVVAEVVRGGFIEGHHCGSAVVVQGHGVRHVVGPTTDPMLPRSCAKPLQAVGMLRLGLEVDDEELAIVCASHTGQPAHVEIVQRVLANAGLSEADLDNTPGMPVDGSARRALIAAGRKPAPITHSCSGKHAGMLATCVANGWPTISYRDPDHPLQVALRETVAELTSDQVTATVVDGCGAPLFAVTLTGLARAFSRLITAAAAEPEGRCAMAMRARPDLVGGTGHHVTRLMTAVPGLLAKDGAEGVYAAALPDGHAVAVKIEDGGDRARVPVLVAAMRAAGVDAAGLTEFETVPVLGHGEPVGAVRAVI